MYLKNPLNARVGLVITRIKMKPTLALEVLAVGVNPNVRSALTSWAVLLLRQVIGYNVSADGKWCLAIGIFQVSPGVIAGTMQLYRYGPIRALLLRL